MIEPWIGVDLDGTLAVHYCPEAGPYDPLRIGDPIPEMVDRVKMWIAQGRIVKVFTARVGKQDGSPSFPASLEAITRIERAIRSWTATHIGTALDVTCAKDYGMVELWDDRAVRVLVNLGTPCCELP